MLRGLGRSSRYWLGFDKRLARSFRVITLDYRGIGRSSQDMAWWDSMVTMGDDVLALLDELELQQVSIFGLSLGGMVALAVAMRAPERVTKLVVANASTGDYIGMRISAKAMLRLVREGRQRGLQSTLLEVLTSRKIVKDRGPQLLNQWNEILAEEGFPAVSVVKQLLAAARFRVRGKLDGQQVPTLILYGTQDQFVPRRNSRKLHELIPHSKLKAIRGVGHEISIGREDELVRILREFCQPVRASGSSSAKSAKRRRSSS
jgi:pimeloyl-ACP methyl ester carboxylesterase